jgi:uncharacterized SAM-binding protein YcdF (DUF218 family)
VLNDLFLWLGIDAWRSAIAALVMPPVPFLVLMLIGARLFSRHRVRAWLLVLLGCLGIWATSAQVVAHGLTQWLLPPTRSLSPNEVGDLKKAPRTAIVVLGGGHRDFAPEYGVSELTSRGVERLRYGLWLSRQTELPVLFSGGRSHGALPGQSEAEIAARIAERDFARPLKWTENESRDTRSNAFRSVALLKEQGIERVVVVTQGYHMPRALDNFRRAVAALAPNMQIVSAPMGIVPWTRPAVIDFLPTGSGYERVRLVLHEFVGRLVGA